MFSTPNADFFLFIVK